MKFYLNPDSEAPHIQRRLAWSGVLGTLALASAGQVMRERPGGPFISLTGDVIPFVAAVVAIIIGFCCLRAYTVKPKLIALIFIAFATVAIAIIIADVHSFWIRPFARGQLLGL